MDSLDVVKILRTLSAEEQALFGEYLAAHPQVQDSLAARLGRYLIGQFQTGSTPDREAAFEAVYPGQPLRDQRLRRVTMELQALLTEFLSYRALLDRDPIWQELDLLRHLLDRNAYGLFAKRIRKTFRQLTASGLRGEDLHLFTFRLHRLYNEYIIHSGGDQDSFEAASEALDRHFLSAKLETWSSMLTREKRYRQRHSYPFREAILAMARELAPSEPEIAIWLLVLDLETGEGDRDTVAQLEQLLREQPGLLPLNKLRQIRGYTLNFLLRHVRPHLRDDYRSIWNLFQTMAGEGTFLISGRVSAPFLRTAVQAACFCGEVEAAEAFLERYIVLLVGEDRQETGVFNRLVIACYAGRYREAIRGCAVFHHPNPRLETLIRVLKLKAWYGLGDDEAFLRQANSFRKFMARHHQPGQRFWEGYNELARFMDRLGKLRFLGMGERKPLEADILASKTGDKLWLFEQVQELGAGN